ncbi:MAG: hypothetical protein ACI89E_001188 [Planctomycetota bacterium]|jgi:hypothetical protein
MQRPKPGTNRTNLTAVRRCLLTGQKNRNPLGWWRVYLPVCVGHGIRLAGRAWMEGKRSRRVSSREEAKDAKAQTLRALRIVGLKEFVWLRVED